MRGERKGTNKKSLKYHPAHAGHRPLLPFGEKKKKFLNQSYPMCSAVRGGKRARKQEKTAEAAMENPHSVTEQSSCNTYFNKVNMMKHSPIVHNTAEKLDPAAEMGSQTPPLQILAVHVT